MHPLLFPVQDIPELMQKGDEFQRDYHKFHAQCKIGLLIQAGKIKFDKIIIFSKLSQYILYPEM